MAPFLTRNPPHNGEMHPDGDELIFLISGRLDVIAEEGGAETVTQMVGGQAVVIPKGTWHRLDIKEPCQLVVMTPGPRACTGLCPISGSRDDEPTQSGLKPKRLDDPVQMSASTLDKVDRYRPGQPAGAGKRPRSGRSDIPRSVRLAVGPV